MSISTTQRILAGIAAFLIAGSAFALDVKPYSKSAFDQAREAGEPVAVQFSADWCPVCKQQEKALSELQSAEGLDMTVLVADFDKERSLKQRLRVNSQSTFVVFRGEAETARVGGVTEASDIRTALASAL